MDRNSFLNLKIVPYKRTVTEDEINAPNWIFGSYSFSNRVVKRWNSYSEEVVSSSSIDCLNGPLL